MFIFVRCCHRYAAAAPVKYKRNVQYATSDLIIAKNMGNNSGRTEKTELVTLNPGPSLIRPYLHTWLILWPFFPLVPEVFIFNTGLGKGQSHDFCPPSTIDVIQFVCRHGGGRSCPGLSSAVSELNGADHMHVTAMGKCWLTVSRLHFCTMVHRTGRLDYQEFTKLKSILFNHTFQTFLIGSIVTI